MSASKILPFFPISCSWYKNENYNSLMHMHALPSNMNMSFSGATMTKSVVDPRIKG